MIEKINGSTSSGAYPESRSLSLISGGDSIELAYVIEGEVIYLISSDYNARWPSYILRNRKADFAIGKVSGSRTPSLITSGEERENVLRKFTAKYGNDYVRKYFSRPARFIRLDVCTERQETGGNYYRWLEEEFDSVADNYDEHIFGNRINVLLRERSLKKLRKYLGKHQNVLEIGCGTGAETLELLRDGHEVFAIDISSRMLDNINAKARKEGIHERLNTMKLSASSIGELEGILGKSAFDAGYSTYGALNCEPDIEKIPGALSVLIKPGGYFIAGVYNKFCLSEMASNILSLNASRLFWRLKNPIREGRSRFCIDVYSFSFREFMSIFGSCFMALETDAVPIILPPSNFTRLINFLDQSYEKLDIIDQKLAGKWPMKYMGDHFLTVLQNRIGS
ncbi:Mg-protoporphyrin IX methyl transferase [Thermoplasmatales archaeon]|nr:Mg-protoporphyrin IX methyl transferase [Thermoplasmatales archaeon]